MIAYTPFWNALKEAKGNWDNLTQKHNVLGGTISCLKNDVSGAFLNFIVPVRCN